MDNLLWNEIKRYAKEELNTMNTNHWKEFKDAMPRGQFLLGRRNQFNEWVKTDAYYEEYLPWIQECGWTHFCEITIPEPPPRKSKLDEAWEGLYGLPGEVAMKWRSLPDGAPIRRDQFTFAWNACLKAHGIKEE